MMARLVNEGLEIAVSFLVFLVVADLKIAELLPVVAGCAPAPRNACHVLDTYLPNWL